MMTDTDNIIADLAAGVTPVKAARGPAALFTAWLLASGLYAAALIVFSGLREDLTAKLHSPLFAAETGALLLMIITGALAATLLAFPDMHQKRGLVAVPLLPLALFLIVVALEWTRDVPPSPKPLHGIECLSCIALYTFAPAGLMLFLLRKYASTHYYTAGALALLAGSSIGCLALRLSEQTDSISHLVEWHYLPIFGFSLIGVILGRLFLKW